MNAETLTPAIAAPVTHYVITSLVGLLAICALVMASLALTDNPDHNVFVGATTATNGAEGLVPAPATQDLDTFLSAQGSWKAVPATASDPFTGATATTNGTTGLVPLPLVRDQFKVLTGSGTWQTLPQPVLFSGATSSFDGSEGLVPKPLAGDELKVLTGGGTWQTLPAMPTEFTGATSSVNGTSGLVIPPLAGDELKFLQGSGAWIAVNASSVFTGATSGLPGTEGLVPQPGAGEEAKFLQGNGLWTAFSAAPTFTGASSGADGTAGVVPQPLAGDEAKVLQGDGTWVAFSAAPFTGASSGADGTAGVVPQPLAGDEAKVLQGDGTWFALGPFTGAGSLVNGTQGLVPQPLAGDEAKVLQGDGTWFDLAPFTGAGSFVNGTQGLVPQPMAGDEGRFLQGDGTWANSSGGVVSYSVGPGPTDQFTTVDAAITYANTQTPSAVNPIAISVSAGIYSDTIVLPDYVSLQGSGPYSTEFTGSISVTGSNNSHSISQCYVHCNVSVATGASLNVNNCRWAGNFSQAGGATGALTFANCEFSGASTFVLYVATSSFTCRDCNGTGLTLSLSMLTWTTSNAFELVNCTIPNLLLSSTAGWDNGAVIYVTDCVVNVLDLSGTHPGSPTEANMYFTNCTIENQTLAGDNWPVFVRCTFNNTGSLSVAVSTTQRMELIGCLVRSTLSVAAGVLLSAEQCDFTQTVTGDATSTLNFRQCMIRGVVTMPGNFSWQLCTVQDTVTLDAANLSAGNILRWDNCSFQNLTISYQASWSGNTINLSGSQVAGNFVVSTETVTAARNSVLNVSNTSFTAPGPATHSFGALTCYVSNCYFNTAVVSAGSCSFNCNNSSILNRSSLYRCVFLATTNICTNCVFNWVNSTGSPLTTYTTVRFVACVFYNNFAQTVRPASSNTFDNCTFYGICALTGANGLSGLPNLTQCVFGANVQIDGGMLISFCNFYLGQLQWNTIADATSYVMDSIFQDSSGGIVVDCPPGAGLHLSGCSFPRVIGASVIAANAMTVVTGQNNLIPNGPFTDGPVTLNTTDYILA